MEVLICTIFTSHSGTNCSTASWRNLQPLLSLDILSKTMNRIGDKGQSCTKQKWPCENLSDWSETQALNIVKYVVMSWLGSESRRLMCFCIYLKLTILGGRPARGGLYLCSFSVCLCSFMLPDASVSEGLQPGSVLTLEPATSATHQLSPTATDSLVKSALFKSVAEIQLALDSWVWLGSGAKCVFHGAEPLLGTEVFGVPVVTFLWTLALCGIQGELPWGHSAGFCKQLFFIGLCK